MIYRFKALLFFLVLCTIGEGNGYRTFCNPSGCPVGWSTHTASTSCYRFVNTPLASWKAARKRCLAMGADLVKISSLRENNYVVYLARTFSYKSSLMWIGLHRDLNRKFIWVDGSKMAGQYTNWHAGEPNDVNGNEGCVQLRLYSNTWNDNRCNFSHKNVFMCEKRKSFWG